MMCLYGSNGCQGMGDSCESNFMCMCGCLRASVMICIVRTNLQGIARTQDVMVLATNHGRGLGITSQLVAANKVPVYLDDDASILQRLEKCVTGWTQTHNLWVASRLLTSDCPALVGALEHAGFFLSLRASAVFSVPEINKSASAAPCEVHERILTQLAQHFFLRLSSLENGGKCGQDDGLRTWQNEGAEEKSLHGRGASVLQIPGGQLMERLVALGAKDAQDRVWHLAAALGYQGKGEQLLEACVGRLQVASVSNITRPLRLRRDAQDPGLDGQQNAGVRSRGDGLGASGRGTGSGVCFACGHHERTSCSCLELEDHLEWAVEWGERSGQTFAVAAAGANGTAGVEEDEAIVDMPVTVFLSRAAVLGELGERGRALYDDLAPLELQGLDLLVNALASILSADGNPFETAAAGECGAKGKYDNAGAGRHGVGRCFGGGCHGISQNGVSQNNVPQKYSLGSVSASAPAGKSSAIEADGHAANVQGQNGAQEPQASMLEQLVREMMSFSQDLMNSSLSSTVPNTHAAATPQIDPGPVERTPRENEKDTGLQMPGDDTMREGVWSSESPQNEGSECGGSAQAVSSRADDERKERPAGSALGPREGIFPSKSSESRNRVEGSGLGEQGARNASPDDDAGVGHAPASVLQVRCVCSCVGGGGSDSSCFLFSPVPLSLLVLLLLSFLLPACSPPSSLIPPSACASTHSCFGLGSGVRG